MRKFLFSLLALVLFFSLLAVGELLLRKLPVKDRKH